LFVLTALTLMCAVTIMVGFQRMFRDTNEYFTCLRTIPRGLQRDSTVYLEGVKVGSISRIEPVFQPDFYAKVFMAIDQQVPVDPSYMSVQVFEPLLESPASLHILVERSGADDEITSPSPTNATAADVKGQANNIVISPSPMMDFDVDVEGQANYIKARRFTRFEAIETQLRSALGNLSGLDIVKLQSAFLEAAHGVSQTLYAINQRINDQRFDAAMTALDGMLTHGAALVSNVTQQVDRHALANTIAYANTTSSNLSVLTCRLERALPDARLRKIADNVDRTFVATPGTLQDLRELSITLQRVAGTLNRVLEAVERNPSALMFSRPTPKTDQPGDTP
jgi:ABC-type transporter Mla subunit MlaD